MQTHAESGVKNNGVGVEMLSEVACASAREASVRLTSEDLRSQVVKSRGNFERNVPVVSFPEPNLSASVLCPFHDKPSTSYLVQDRSVTP